MTFAACGDDSASSSEPAALTVVASEPAEGEYAFDVPAEMEGGTVTITLDNTGAEGHEIGFVQVEEGTTAQEFADQVLASGEDAPIPDFVLNAPGGVGGAAPGATRAATVEFEDGTYVYFCTFGGEEEGSVPHYQAGMLGEVTVSGSASTAALPESTGHRHCIGVHLRDRGTHHGRADDRVHERRRAVPPPVCAADGRGRDARRVDCVPSAPKRSPRVRRRSTSRRRRTSPSSAQAPRRRNLNLEAGSYVFMCFLTDREGGPPHFAKGMAVQVDVS